MDASIFGTVGGQRALAALSSLPQITRELESLTAEVASLRECFAKVGEQFAEITRRIKKEESK